MEESLCWQCERGQIQVMVMAVGVQYTWIEFWFHHSQVEWSWVSLDLWDFKLRIAMILSKTPDSLVNVQ